MQQRLAATEPARQVFTPPTQDPSRFTAKDGILTAVAVMLAIPGAADADPWVVVPTLLISVGLFFYLILTHGPTIGKKLLLATLVTLVLGAVGVRSMYHARQIANNQSPKQEPPPQTPAQPPPVNVKELAAELAKQQVTVKPSVDQLLQDVLLIPRIPTDTRNVFPIEVEIASPIELRACDASIFLVDVRYGRGRMFDTGLTQNRYIERVDPNSPREVIAFREVVRFQNAEKVALPVESALIEAKLTCSIPNRVGRFTVSKRYKLIGGVGERRRWDLA